MKKIYIAVLSVSLLFTGLVNAQRVRTSPMPNSSIKPVRILGTMPLTTQKLSKAATFADAQPRTAAGCDTVNYPIPNEWNLTIYSGPTLGYVTGTNKYSDLEKAAYFDVSSTPNTFLTKTYIYFGKANSNRPANLTKIVPIHVYAGTLDSGPTTLLATVNKTLAQLKADVDGRFYTSVTFPGGVALPAGKEFFISVDISNLVYDSTSASAVKDTLAIVSTTDGDALADYNGAFYEKLDNGDWLDGVSSWELDINLAIFPIIGTSPDCGTLPITLTDFSGERQASKNVLKWITASEQNNLGFELQRSADGANFTSLGFTNSKGANGNSNASLTYLFDDIKPFKGNSYYRLKQVDKDGKFKFSPIVILKGQKATNLTISSIYPNPAKSILNMVIAAPANDKINLMVTDMAGKLVMQQAAQMISGNNNLQLNVGRLPLGSYMIKAVCAAGCETAVSKFVKQ